MDSIMYDLVKEIREDNKEMLKEQVATRVELARMAEILDKNTDSLILHEKRSDNLESLYKIEKARVDELESKVSKLEEPVKFRQMLVVKIAALATFVTTVVGAIAVVYQYLKQ